jgi:lipopolysaccharide heptosyltransferase I
VPRALVVRLSAIGDVVHALPVLAALRAHGWETGWVVEPSARPLLEGNPDLSRLWPAPPARLSSWRVAHRVLADLRAKEYDVALDLQGLWKSAAWARLSGAGRVVGLSRRWRREPASAMLVREHVELTPGIVHVIDENLALLGPLGIDAVGRRDFPLPAAAAEERVVERSLEAMGLSTFAVLNPGGGWPSKLWPAESFGALARGLRDRGLPSLVTWGPGEEALADRVAAASAGAARRAFPTTLLEYVALVRRARLVVAGDTGPMHLACAVGRPVVALFGPTDPARNGPFAAADVVVRPPSLEGRGGRFRIPGAVMDEITVERALAAVDRRLASSGAAAHAV